MRTGEERERCIEIIVCPWMWELPCDGRAAREPDGSMMWHLNAQTTVAKEVWGVSSGFGADFGGRGRIVESGARCREERQGSSRRRRRKWIRHVVTSSRHEEKRIKPG